jgi:nucleotide-binding universal stress UspA family protein
MSERFTVGYDGSAESQRAVDWAVAEAELTGAIVEVVGCYTIPVVVSPWLPTVPFDERTVASATANDVAVAVELARKRHPDVKFDEVIVRGSPRTQLVAEAAGSDLLVVGSTGADAAESWLLGSVAHAAARTSPCPVVIVPRSDPPVHNRIVVAADGSDAAHAALVWATDEADRRNADLVVVHAWEYPYGDELSSVTMHDLIRLDATLVLEDAVRTCRDRGRGSVRGRLVHDAPATAILDAAAHADLVVVGSRGRGGFRSLLFGSVAHTVT